VLIDSHVNLHHAMFDADRDAVIAAARAAGVEAMISICDRLDNLPAIAAIAEADAQIFMSAGVHPHHAKDVPDLTAQMLTETAARYRKVIAIGETGLDQHYHYSPIDAQIQSFAAHLEAARALDLPVIIHTREADALTGQMLETAAAAGPLRILMHCYTSSLELAQTAWRLGGYISFSGIMTFKAAHAVREVARQAPLERVILETDCPYLTPVPFRGRRCEPAHVAHVYDAFAALRGIDPADLRATVADNFYRLFSKATR
jgi:TatD DNase family protein